MPRVRVVGNEVHEPNEMDDNYDDTIKYRATRELKMGLWVLTALVVCILMHFSHSLGELREEIAELDNRLTQKLSASHKNQKEKTAAQMADPDRKIRDLEARLTALQEQHTEAVATIDKVPKKLKAELKDLTEKVSQLSRKKRE